MAVGSLLVIPISVIVQLIFGGTTMSWIEGVGVSCIVLGCLTFELGELIFRRLRGHGGGCCRCRRDAEAAPLLTNDTDEHEGKD